MPLTKMLLQFLWMWALALLAGLFTAAWYGLSDTIMTYGLLLLVVPLVVHRFPKMQQRPFSSGEQYWAIAGLAGIALGVNLALTTLLTPSSSAYGAALYPPLPLSVIQGFIILQAPLYSVISWLFIRAANERFLARRPPPTDRPSPMLATLDEEIPQAEPPLSHHRGDHYNYPLRRPR